MIHLYLIAHKNTHFMPYLKFICIATLLILIIFTFMNLSRFLLSFVICSVLTVNAEAKTSLKKHKTYFKLVEAYTQRIMPGIPGASPQTSTHFIIVWDAPKPPEAFFWRENNDWRTCSVVKAYKLAGKPGNLQMGIDYIKETIAMNKIRKGDTLELTPVAAGKSPAPADVPASAKNTLYFKTGGSNWLAFPVKNIGKKQDIAMP
jgi:hypothetical protein